MHLAVPDYGLLLTIIGIGLGLWKEKRKFDRTNAFGVEQFQSFSRKMVATTFDQLLTWSCLASFSIGLLILAFS